MANKAQAITADTPKRLIFDAGALYRDWGETQEGLIGATAGGSSFTVEKEDRVAEIDGMRGPVMGLRRAIRHTAVLETTLVEIPLATWLELTRGTSTSDGTKETVTPGLAIVTSDYLTNVALAADVSVEQGTVDPTPCVLILLNALNVDEWSVTVDDEDEGKLATRWAAHYAAATDFSTPPYLIEWPIEAS